MCARAAALAAARAAAALATGAGPSRHMRTDVGQLCERDQQTNLALQLRDFDGVQ